MWLCTAFSQSWKVRDTNEWRKITKDKERGKNSVNNQKKQRGKNQNTQKEMEKEVGEVPIQKA